MAIELEITALPWLERLLSITTFFSVCNDHPEVVCNKYCLDCNERPLCNSCTKTSEHDDHRVIQIRRSTYNVVKATDIQDHVNINGIHKYMINGSKVVFLKKRFNYEGNMIRNNCRFTCNCRVCHKNLVDSSDFCSLECKLEWVKVNGTFVIRARKDLEETTKTSSSSSTSNTKNENLAERTPKRKLEEEEEENTEQKVESVISRPISFRRANSRRKGTPHRAPFF